MRVLMTGHLGYIGTVAVPLFQGAGHEVVGLDSDLYRRCTYGKAVGPAADIEAYDDDIRDVPAKVLKGFDAIVHYAGLSNDPLGNLNPENTFDINHRAVITLAEKAKQMGVPRFVFSSTCSNYGASGDKVINEDDPFHPVTPYGRAKVQAEIDLAKMASADFTPTMMRSATAFGYSPRIRFDLVVNNLSAYAHTTGEVFLKSDGTPWRPIVHIEDIARAFLAVCEAPRETVHNQAFNVGSVSEVYQVIDIAKQVMGEFPGTEIKFAPGAKPDPSCYRVDCSRLARTFPHAVPRWTALDGIRELHRVFKTEPLTKDEFEGARYARRPHVVSLIEEGVLGDDLRWRH